MNKTGSFWLGLIIGVAISGSISYRLGLQAGGTQEPLSPSPQRDLERQNPEGRKTGTLNTQDYLCAEKKLATLSPQSLLNCLQINGFTDNSVTLISALRHYFAYVLARQAPLSRLVDSLAERGSASPEYLLTYIEAEVDREKIGLASETLKQLLRLQGKRLFSGSGANELIDYLNRLLWLTPEDISLHLWLAKLFLQQGQVEDVRYHALIAANIPAYQEEAADLLREIDPEGDDDGSIVVNLEIMDDQYFIAAEINGYPARLLLDTGASISGVASQFVEKHRDIVGETQSIVLSTAGGLKTEHTFTVDELVFGELRFSDHVMVIFSGVSFRGFDGVLGVDVLQQADFYIDRKESKLRILAPKERH